MGSSSRANTARARARDRALSKLAKGKTLTEDALRLVANFPKRHKCPCCATGGHRRRTPRIGGAFVAEKA